MVALPKYVWFCLLVLVIGIWAAPVQAASEDAALFQEALAPYGQWLQHNRYGLVWRPSRVEANWRPYTNGRWVLTQDGYVFETDEPWGWATYHYGNWQNTPEYGWIWIPGRTWYPHTVTWRANDEHVGWAPVPPPETTAESTSWLGDAGGALDYGASGYSPASLPPTSWIFTRVNDFLYGWGEPYSPRYSYYNAGLLAAPRYVPVIYERTVYIYNYVTPAYAPRACYNWGPSVTYITKVTNINQQDVHRRVQRHRLHHLHNALPPHHVMARHPAWRQLVPVAATEGQRSGRWWTPVQTRNMALNRPDALPRPASLPPRLPAAAPSQVSAPDRAAVHSGQPATGPGPRSDNVREVGAVGPSPPDTAGRPARPGRPQPDPAKVGPPLAGVTTDNQTARPRLAAPASAPVASAPLGADPAAKVQDRSPQPPPLRTQTPSPDDAPGVSSRPSPPSELSRPPGATAGRPGPEAGAVLPPENRRVQEEQQRRRFQEQEEFRQQALRRQHQEQQQRQAEVGRQQQEQQRRQLEMIRQQQVQQQRPQDLIRHQQEQQRQAEVIRQQQEQQRRQAEMVRQQQEQQRRQAEMVRQQQEQQRRQLEMIRQQQVQQQQRRQAEMQQHRQGGGQPAPVAEGQKGRPNGLGGF